MPWQFLADRITLAMEGKGVTAQQLAPEIGVTVQQLQQWERGEVKPNQDSLCRICDATGFQPRFFFAESGNIGN